MHYTKKYWTDEKHYLYSYHWAEGVVQDFTEKLWRGTEMLAKMSDLSKEDCKSLMIHYVRLAWQQKWRLIKIVVKSLDDDVEMLECSYTRTELKKYLTLIKMLAREKYIKGENPPAGY